MIMQTRFFICATVRFHVFTQPISCTKWRQTMKRDIFQAIADPTRRAIIALIAAQAMTPNALADHFDISRQATSKHIRILNECGLLAQEKTGREIHYQLKLEKMQEIDVWLEQFRKLWETRYSQLDDLLIDLKNGESKK